MSGEGRPDDDAATLDLEHLARAAARFLHRLAGDLAAHQDEIGRLVATLGPGALAPRDLEALQSVDALTQSLSDIARFTDELSLLAAGVTRRHAEVAAQLRLERSRRALLKGHAPPPEADQSGDVAFF